MNEMTSSAIISKDGLYRYSLERAWDKSKPTVLFVCLNPSVADDKIDDHTVKNMIFFAKKFGYGRLLVGNLFAFRATDPSELFKQQEPIGPENDSYLEKMMEEADLIIAAWGDNGGWLDRSYQFKEKYKNKEIKCLGKTKANQPRHPSRISYKRELEDL